jgi:hypothetical protein
MTLSELAAAARARAEVSIDPHDHAVAAALEAALDAEARAAIRATEEPSVLSGIPPWSEVSRPGTVSWPPMP